MADQHSADDTPRVAGPPPPGGNAAPGDEPGDSLASPGPQAYEFIDEFGGLGSAFTDAVHAMGAVGPDVEDNYQRALRVLREYPPDEITTFARRGWQSLPEEAYLDRWGLVQLLTDLRLSDAAGVLAAVVATPVPPERSPGADHRHSTVGEEVVIRTTAVEGLARLAAEGDPRAVEALVRHLDDDQRGVRAACVTALRGLPGGAPVDLTELVREDDRDLLTARRPDVREVPQVERVDYVLHPGAGADPPPPPR